MICGAVVGTAIDSVGLRHLQEEFGVYCNLVDCVFLSYRQEIGFPDVSEVTNTCNFVFIEFEVFLDISHIECYD